MRRSTQSPETPTDEDAFNFLVSFLTSGSAAQYGYEVYIPAIMHRYLETISQIQQDHHHHYPVLSPPFFSAAWELCRRGILRPGVMSFGQQSTPEGAAGSGYTITRFGKQWLKEAQGRFDYIPMEPGRFNELLNKYNSNFGAPFRLRAQEAVRCYGAHAFLACCAMCGAAAEAIILALAIRRDGDAQKVADEYFASGGRGRIEARLTGQLAEPVKRDLRGHIGLLKYWRDSSAHGMDTVIDDNEAFTSLALLLRFAQFATDHWDEVTRNTGPRI